MAVVRSFWLCIGLMTVSACVLSFLLDGASIDVRLPQGQQQDAVVDDLQAQQHLGAGGMGASRRLLRGPTRDDGENDVGLEAATNTNGSSPWSTSVVGLLVDGLSSGAGGGAATTSPHAQRPILRLHVHVVAIGDSLAFGVSAKNLRYPNPYAPTVARTIAQQLQLTVRTLAKEAAQQDVGGGGGAGGLWTDATRVSHSSEVHAFPGFHSKKLIFALRKLETTNLTLYLASRAAAMQQRAASPTAGSGGGSELPFEDWFSAGGSGDTVANVAAATTGTTTTAVATNADDDATMLDAEEQSEDILGGRRLDGAGGGGGGTGGRPAGSTPSKKGGAQGYSKQMMQSEGINDKDLVELSYESFYRRFAQRTVDAERLAMGLGVDAGGKNSRSSGNSSGSQAPPPPPPPPVDVLVVFCTVFTGINDAILGIPWWWVKSNLHKLHDACRKRVEDSVTASVRTMATPPRAVVVVSVPLRMLPPYYFLQEGNTAQTQRRAKRVLDPQGFCEFYFRSPRRKLNLYLSMDMMPWVGLSSKYSHARLLESMDAVGDKRSGDKAKKEGLLLWNPTGMSNRWCRRPTSCHGLPVAADHSRNGEARRAVSPQTNSCKLLTTTTDVPLSSAGGQHTTALCFLQRTMIPIDKHFVFPDKLSSSALWRLVLSRWDDCIHPSPYGYRTMSEFLAGALHRDAEKLLRTMTMGAPQAAD